jgi:hypothetical protein
VSLEGKKIRDKSVWQEANYQNGSSKTNGLVSICGRILLCCVLCAVFKLPRTGDIAPVLRGGGRPQLAPRSTYIS